MRVNYSCIVLVLSLGISSAHASSSCSGRMCSDAGATPGSALLQSKNARLSNTIFQAGDDDAYTSTTTCPQPDEIGPVVASAWKEFIQDVCHVSWDDAPLQLRTDVEALDGTHLNIVPLEDSTCKAIIPHDFLEGRGDLGLVLRKVDDAGWTVDPFSLKVEQVQRHACEELIPMGTPENVVLPSATIDEVFVQLQNDFAGKCGGQGHELGKKSVVESKRTTMTAGESGKYQYIIKFMVSPPSREDEIVVAVVEEDIPDDEVEAAAARQRAWELRHQREAIQKIEGDDADEQAEGASLLAVARSSAQSRWDVIGSLRVRDDLYQPRLCCVCGQCSNAKVCEGGDDDNLDTPSNLSFAQHVVVGHANLTTPAHGDLDSFRAPARSVHPAADFKTYRSAEPRQRSEPRLGDNFHSTILSQRSATDHARVWAQSRALVSELKWSGISVPDDYHFYDDDIRAQCFQRAYDQGKCGSCWAFASLGALEKQICMKSGGSYKPSLSREMLVRCSEQNFACEGGNADKAYEDLMEIGGVWSTDCLPYQGKGSKHCPAFSYSWFGQGSTGDTGNFARIDQEIMKSCKDLTRFSNRPPVGREWDMPFIMMYEARVNESPNITDPRVERFRKSFAKARSRDRVPSWWLYGEEAMKAALTKYGSIYASYIAMDDFKNRACSTGCWPPGTVWGEEADFLPSDCGCPKNGHAVHIIGYGTDIQETGTRVPYWLIENSWGESIHGNILGEDSDGVKGWGKDPFTELHPLGMEDKCILAGWYAAVLPKTGGCAGQTVNIRDDIKVTGGPPDGFYFAVEIDGNVVYHQDVPANSAGMFMQNVSIGTGIHSIKFLVNAKNHPKQQALQLEQYKFSAVSLRCRGRGYVYSFTKNDTKANLSWGRQTRAELKAAADKLLMENGIDVHAKYDRCPEACRTGSYSSVIPCEGLLTKWGSCYTDEYYKNPNNYYLRNDYYQALCWNCTELAIAQEEEALAIKNLDNATFIQWHTLVQQAFDAPDEPGWMRQFAGSCQLESSGHNKNTQMTAAYEVELPNGADGNGGCDERHSAPFEKGFFVSASGPMAHGETATTRCPRPMRGNVSLACNSGILTVTANTCEERLAGSLGSRGYFKIIRGHNYHGVESGAAFAIAEMTRFLDVCPTTGWSKWSSCNATEPCKSGTQTRSRNAVNGFHESDPGCAEVSFHGERPCVGPGFCSQVLTRFMSTSTADIEGALAAYKSQSTQLHSNAYASAGAHFMDSAYPSCAEAKYWCRMFTGNDYCGMVTEGHFEIKKAGSYVIKFDPSSGGGHFEFNTFGKGNEGKSEYQVRAAQGGSEMYVWQDVGFHHRRRRTDVKPWNPISSIHLEKGRYFGRMSRVQWWGCPDFSLVIEESTSVYADPLLAGVAGITDAARDDLGGGTQKQRSWDFFTYSRRRHPASEQGAYNELVLRDQHGYTVERHTINRTNFTAASLYEMFNIDARSPSLPAANGGKHAHLELRMTVLLPAAGTYKFRFQHDTSSDDSNAEWRIPDKASSASSYAKARVQGRNEYSKHMWGGGSTVIEHLVVVHQGGQVTYEWSSSLPCDGVDDYFTFPNFMELQVKKEDMLHRGPEGSLSFGTTVNHLSEINVLYGDDEARIDWPDRDDPFDSELRTSTFKELPRNAILVGKQKLVGFMAEIEGQIDAGACLSLDARVSGANDADAGFKGMSLELCDLDGAKQYLELATLSGVNASKRSQIGWVHIGFKEATHLRMRRDPNDLGSIEFGYRPDNRLHFASPFSSHEVAASLNGFDGKFDVGVSMVSPESYRYAEFQNISIEECASSCEDDSAQQLFCGEIITACGNKLACNANCSGAGYSCHDQMCMKCPDSVTAVSNNTECGFVSQVCQNHKNQDIVVDVPIGFAAPSPNHYCENGTWKCHGKSKWTYLAEGKQCGKTTNNCNEEIHLFSCPNERDECTQEHKCVCSPMQPDPSYQCGWQGDGCGRNLTFGSLDGHCPKTTHVCHNHLCCTPKTVADFSDAFECGSEDDGCGGRVHFSRSGATENHGCGAGRGWSCDVNHKCQHSGPVYSCYFEEPASSNRFCDFFDNTKGPASSDIYWSRTSGATPSHNTGPAHAYDGSYYIFTEASSTFNKKAFLKSIPFNASAGMSLAFHYHMYGSSMGTLTVRSVEGASTTDIWSMTGSQGDAWAEAAVDLSAYTGHTIQIEFEGATGSSWSSDIAIDDVEVLKPATGAA